MKISDHSSLFKAAKKTPLLRKRGCPYWAPVCHHCRLITEGLFIPSKQHVACYCLSRHHSWCYQYEFLVGSQNTTDTEERFSINRRRSVRIPSHTSLRFSEISGNDQREDGREYDAWAIDLSEHGIRCAGRWLLIPDTPIHFILEDDTIGTKAEGTGRVIWSKPVTNKLFFQSGIAFSEPPYPVYPSRHHQTKQV